MKPIGDGWMELYSNGLGHMLKMAAMPLYGKILKQIFFSRISRLIGLKLGI